MRSAVPFRTGSLPVPAPVFGLLLLLALVTVASVADAQSRPEADSLNSLTLLDETVCAPTLTYSEPDSSLHLIGTTDTIARQIYGPPQTLIVRAAEGQRLEPAQRYFVRRVPLRFGGQPPDGEHPVGVHTAGVVRILDVTDDTATATILRACDGLLPGDYLDPFLDTKVSAREASGSVSLEALGTVMGGDEERAIAAERDIMLIDRGSDHGVAAGDTFVVLRKKIGEDTPLAELGEGIVLAVRPDTATVQITRTRDAVSTGDRVAFRR